MPTGRQLTPLQSGLSPEQCRERIIRSADNDEVALWPDFKGCRPIFCQMKADGRFRLRCRWDGRNAFGPFFYGRLVPVAKGTVIGGRFEICLLTRIFMGCCLGGLLGGLAFALSLRDGRSLGQYLALIPALVGIGAVGYGIVRLGQWCGRAEERRILALLHETLEVPAAGPKDSAA